MRKLILIILSLFLFLPVFAEDTGTIILPSAKGIVQSIDYFDSENLTKQNVKVKILSGDFKGEVVELENVLSGNPYYDINLSNNTKVVLHAEDNGEGVQFSIEDVQRSGNLLWLSLIFCGLLVYVGKIKGLYSIISIIITVFLITNMLSPMILLGINAVFASILICILSTIITMYLVGGINSKSTSASIGATLSLGFAAIISAIVMKTASLTGFCNETTMFLYSTHPELNFVNITISAMILATLGAVMDVAMSIASTINEIFETDDTKKTNELFESGMNVGRDIIGTMANTLILVYLGGSLPLVMLSSNIDLQKFINLNQVVTEISSAIIGSIAIVICVPFTAFVSSRMIKRFHKNTVEPSENII